MTTTNRRTCVTSTLSVWPSGLSWSRKTSFRRRTAARVATDRPARYNNTNNAGPPTLIVTQSEDKHVVLRGWRQRVGTRLESGRHHNVASSNAVVC